MPRRLIEEAFPLKEVSKHSKHEQGVSQGKPNNLHYWPARRPIAVCRAVTLAALLPDPAKAPEKLKKEYTRLSGSPLPEKQRDYLCNDLIVSLTQWGDENGHGDWNTKDQKGRWVNKLRIARELILMAYDEHPPKVMDMFAGGGAIPLEAMRLGCEVTAIDYNPVAWLILKCTLEYPQRLAGETHLIPDLKLSENPDVKEGNIISHVRLWGQWVLENARQELTRYYPVDDKKPTVAYLWARTIPCQDPQCGATIPLLKTLWICKKLEKILKDTPENRNRPDFLRLKKTRNQTKVVINGKRALRLRPDPETKRVQFEIFTPTNADDVKGSIMSGSTATCPFPDCGTQQPDEYIKRCGHEGKLKAQMTAVVYKEEYGKEYRLPTRMEVDAAEIPKETLEAMSDEIPYGMPCELLPKSDTSGAGRAFTAPIYGFKKWSDLFTNRQLLALMTFVKWTRLGQFEMEKFKYPPEWREAISAYLALLINKLADYNCTCATWQPKGEGISNLFVAARVPITWDYVEANIVGKFGSSYQRRLTTLSQVLSRLFHWAHSGDPLPSINCADILETMLPSNVDLIITDPPYYDAIPYADTSDFFFLWNKRNGFVPEKLGKQTVSSVTPKEKELIQHTTRFGGSEDEARIYYTLGMTKAFEKAHNVMSDDAALVIVFAHKEPEAWEALLEAIIGAGFAVTTSWPIDTEKGNRTAAHGRAALATSLWLVCRKRSTKARIGHYSKVKSEMRERITERLRYFWDAGIRGPDFVWAAIGPALESYSSYKEVRRQTGDPYTVSEFLTEVRRIVTDFALGQVLHGASTEALDEWTRYYLMHKDYFGTENAPVGECILLAQGYGVSLDDLRAAQVGILKKASSGNALKLLGYTERTSERVGFAHTSGRIPMIDMIHRIMRLWDAGEREQINAYFHEHGLQENPLFKAVVQALIETSPQGASERSLMETLINYEPGEPVSGVSNPGRSDSDVVQLRLPLGENSS